MTSLINYISKYRTERLLSMNGVISNQNKKGFKSSVIKKIVLILLFSTSSVFAQNGHPPFEKGEKLSYKVHYGLVSAGMADLEVQTKHSAYKFIAKGRSTGLFNLFFKVRNTYESLVDKYSLKPNQFHRDIREGDYVKKESVFFNYELKQAESTRDTIPLPENTQDLLSIFYYMRAQNFDTLQIGNKQSLQVYLDDEFMNSKLEYLGLDTIKTKFGWIPCTQWSPQLQTGRVFKDEQGVKLWISNDENKIPIQIKAKIMVGSIKMDLIKYSGTKEKLTKVNRK